VLLPRVGVPHYKGPKLGLPQPNKLPVLLQFDQYLISNATEVFPATKSIQIIVLNYLHGEEQKTKGAHIQSIDLESCAKIVKMTKMALRKTVNGEMTCAKRKSAAQIIIAPWISYCTYLY